MSHIVDAHVAYIKTISDLNQDKAELLKRIQRLEEELMEVKNKHAVLIADVVLNEDRAEQIKRLSKANLQLREGAEEQKQLIKRLKEDSKRLAWLLETGLAWRGCYNDYWVEGQWLYSSQYAIATIDKAKEDKL